MRHAGDISVGLKSPAFTTGDASFDSEIIVMPV